MIAEAVRRKDHEVLAEVMSGVLSLKSKRLIGPPWRTGNDRHLGDHWRSGAGVLRCPNIFYPSLRGRLLVPPVENHAEYNYGSIVNPAGAGGRRHPRGDGGGGHKVPPLYFSRNISATRKRRSAKLCTHLPEYLAEVVCKFGADRISDDVTVTSEVRL